MTARELASVRKIKKQLEKAEERLSVSRANQRIKCCCGKFHAIKSCDLIVTHWYVEPYSCSGGDYWVAGEWNFVGPCGVRNRLLFHDYDVEYYNRDGIGIAAEPTFKYNYPRELWKSKTDEYDDKSGTNHINYYVDEHREKFGLPKKGKS